MDFDHHSADTDDLGLDIGLGVNYSASVGDHEDHEDLMMKDFDLGVNDSAGDHDHEDLAKIT